MKRCVVLFTLVSIGCAAHRAPQALMKARGEASGPVIVRLVGRDTAIVARAGRNGATYALESNAGEVLVPGKTLNELRVQHPDLAGAVQTLEASAWAGL